MTASPYYDPTLAAAQQLAGGGDQSVTGIVFTVTPTFPTASVNHSLTAIVLTATPTLPAASLDHSVTAQVLSATPMLPAASITVSVTAITLTNTPTQPQASVDHSLTAVVLTVTPTLPVASAQVASITAVVLTTTPTMPAASVSANVDAAVLTATPSLPGAQVNHALTAVVLEVTPTLPAAGITLPVYAIVLEATPTLPVASVQVASITATVLTATPVLPAATLDAATSITAVVITATPSLPAASVQIASIQAIVLTATPTFPTAAVGTVQTITATVLTATPSLPATRVWHNTDPYGIQAARALIEQPVGAVVITAGDDDPQTVIDANPAGTTYWFDGTFEMTYEIKPDNGDTLITNNAILDGGAEFLTGGQDIEGSTLSTAPDSGIALKDGGERTDVTIQGFEIRRYVLRGIQPWLGTYISHCLVHHNYRNGIGGGFEHAPNNGGTEPQAIIEDCIIWDNGSADELGSGAAGIKHAATGDAEDFRDTGILGVPTPGSGVEHRRLYLYRNYGNGLWYDVASGGDIVEDCVAKANSRKGFYYEVSTGPAEFTSLTAEGNVTWAGEADRPFSSDSGIGVGTSTYVTITDCRTSGQVGKPDGILLDKTDDRATEFGHGTDFIDIVDNNLTDSDVLTIKDPVYDPPHAATDIVTTNNTDEGATARGASYDGTFDADNTVTAAVLTATPTLPAANLTRSDALSVAEIGSGVDTLSADSYTTAAVTFTEDEWVLACIVVRKSVISGSEITAVASTSFTFAKLGGATMDPTSGQDGYVEIWAVRPGSTATEAITITGSGTSTNWTAGMWHILEVTNGDAADIIQGTAATNATGAATSLTATLGAYSGGTDRPLFFVLVNENTETIDEEAGYTQVGTDNSDGAPLGRSGVFWNLTTQDTSPSASWTSSRAAAMVAIKLNSAVAGVDVSHAVLTATPSLPTARIDYSTIGAVTLTATPVIPSTDVIIGIAITAQVLTATPILPAAAITLDLSQMFAFVLAITPSFPGASVVRNDFRVTGRNGVARSLAGSRLPTRPLARSRYG